MNNSVDVIINDSNQLAYSACRYAVLLDGAPVDFLEVLSISRSGPPDFGSAELAFIPKQPCDINLLAIDYYLRPWQKINIGLYVETNPPLAANGFYSVFEGYIVKTESSILSDNFSMRLFARDISCKLQKITVCGRRVSKGSSTVFIDSLETIFNPDGRGNASIQQIWHNGKCYKMFTARQADRWTIAQAIDYLLSEYAGQYIIWPDIEHLENLTGGTIAADLDVTGTSLLTAIDRCCHQCGIEFDLHNNELVFYKKGFGRTVELDCQRTGESLNIAKTNIASVKSFRTAEQITHRYICQGDYKIYEATFNLIGGWQKSLESTDYDRYNPAFNPNFQEIKDVYRKWVLNEAGDYIGSDYYGDEPFDFSTIFEGGAYIASNRRFYPCLSFDAAGKSVGYFLEVSYNEGQSWQRYLRPFELLQNECGIWLADEQLDADVWFSLLKGIIRFRITATVISDERLQAVIADGPIAGVNDVIDKIITLPRRFKYRKVSPQSIFYGNSTGADHSDDAGDIAEFARGILQKSAMPVEKIDAQLIGIQGFYQPGDVVKSSPAGRDILNLNGLHDEICLIEQVKMDFQKQCTNIQLAKYRLFF